MSNEIFYGAKYDKNLNRSDIAKALRADVKAAIKAGELPNLTISARVKGSSINVRITKFEGPVMNIERASVNARGQLDFDVEGMEWIDGRPVRPSYYSKALDAAVSKIDSMLAAYNFDGSDIMTDYFHVNFYSSVGVCWEYERDSRAELLEALNLAGWVGEQAAA